MRGFKTAVILLFPVWLTAAAPLQQYRAGVRHMEKKTAAGNRLAVQQFLTALQSNPYFFKALRNLGKVYFRMEQYHRAKKMIQRALQQQPADTETNLFYARILLKLKKTKQAAKHIKHVLQRQPRNVQALYIRALYHRAVGRDDLARNGLESLTRINNSYYPAWLLLGGIHYNNKKYKLAEQAYRQAVAAAGNVAETHYRLGDFYYLREQGDKAEVFIKRCLRIDGDHYRALDRLARIHIERKNWSGALAPAVRLANRYPQNYRYRAMAAGLYQALADADSGNIARAAVHYRAALRLRSNDEALRYRFEEFAVNRLPIRSAIRRQLAAFQRKRGDWYYGRNQLRRAETAYRRGVRLNPVARQIRLKLAILYRDQRRWESLLNVMKIMVKLAPNDTSLQDKYTFYQTVLQRLPSRTAGIKQFSVQSAVPVIWVSDMFTRYNVRHGLYNLSQVYAGALRDALQPLHKVQLMRNRNGKGYGDTLRESIQLASAQGADYCLTGRYIRNNEFLIIEIQLFSVSTGELLYKNRVSRRGNLRLFEAVASLADDLDRRIPLVGRITAMDGDRVTINLGKNHGVKPGTVFLVYQSPRFRSEYLKRFATVTNGTPVGRVKVDQVDELISFGEVISRQTFDGVSSYQYLIPAPPAKKKQQQ